MAGITGAGLKAGVKIASTWGTSVVLGAGNGIVAEITPNFNPTQLQRRMIGSGRHMAAPPKRGNFVPTFSLTGDAGYHNNMAVLLAQILGTSAAPTETTASQADYLHLLTFNTTANSKYLTFGYQNTSATTIVCPTAVCRSFGLRSTAIPGYLEWSAELLGNTVEFTPSNNDFSDMNAITVPDDELASFDFESSLWIDDAAAAAINSSDVYAITSFDLSLSRPQEIIPEARGAAGNGAPIVTDLFTASLNIGVKELVDNTYYTVWSAETVKKGVITVEGSQIGSGTNKSIVIYIPNLCLADPPENPITSPGINPLSLNFTIAAPASTVTGMTDSIYPHFKITNGLATSLLA